MTKTRSSHESDFMLRKRIFFLSLQHENFLPRNKRQNRMCAICLQKFSHDRRNVRQTTFSPAAYNLIWFTIQLFFSIYSFSVVSVALDLRSCAAFPLSSGYMQEDIFEELAIFVARHFVC